MDIFEPGFLSAGMNVASELSDLGTGVPSAKPRETEPPQGIRELQKEVARQRLVLEVLVRALVDKGLYTREQLNAIANLVDMEDGIRDGRYNKKKEVRQCSRCGRTLHNVSGTCLYCGYEEVMEIV